jgi:hypothetical protein
MYITKKPDGQLCFSCAECSWTCERPEDLDDFDKGYEGFKMQFEIPTLEDIEAVGWLEYCTHEIVENVCEFCGFDLYGAPGNKCPSCDRQQTGM